MEGLTFEAWLTGRKAAYHLGAAKLSLNVAKLLSECRRRVTAMSEAHLAKADEYLAKLERV